MVVPVTKSEACEAKYKAVPAISSGCPHRPAGVRARISSFKGIAQLEIVTRPTNLLLPAAAAVLFVATLAGGALTTRFDSDHPLASKVFYALNNDSGKAIWATDDESVNFWSAQYLSDSPARGPLPDFFSDGAFLQHEAPSVDLAPLLASLIEDRPISGVRVLRLRISSERRAERIAVYLRDTEVLSSSVNGKPIRDIGPHARNGLTGGWMSHYANVPEGGFEVSIENACDSSADVCGSRLESSWTTSERFSFRPGMTSTEDMSTSL